MPALLIIYCQLSIVNVTYNIKQVIYFFERYAEVGMNILICDDIQTETEKLQSTDIIMQCGTRVPISKSYADVKKKYMQWVFGEQNIMASDMHDMQGGKYGW